jgi:hypothetical protein
MNYYKESIWPAGWYTVTAQVLMARLLGKDDVSLES